MVSADELKIKAAAHLGEKSAALLNWLLERRDRLLAAILTGTNLATVIAAAVLTSFFHESMPRREFIAPFILAPLSLLVGESLPKLLTLKRPLAFAIFAVRPLRVLTLVLAPLLSVETWLGRGVRRLFGVAPGHRRRLRIARGPGPADASPRPGKPRPRGTRFCPPNAS